MKKILLILLMLAIPWQAIASVERNLTHVLGSGSGKGIEFVSKHIAEHAEHIAHHHHDDDDDADESGTHVDNSHKSLQHLADFEKGCNMNILLAALSELSLPVTVRVVPIFRSDGFPDRTISPLLRPPRALA